MNTNYFDFNALIKTEENQPYTPSLSHLLPFSTFPIPFSLGLKLKTIEEFLKSHVGNFEMNEIPSTEQKEDNEVNEQKLTFNDIEKEITRQQNAENMREFRKSLPEEEKEKRRQKAAEYMREFRKNLPEVEKQIRRQIDTERMRRFRKNLSEIEKEIRKQKAKERMRKQRDILRQQSLDRVK